MSAVWTVRSLLAWMNQDFEVHGIGTPRLDAELLVAQVLGCDRVRLYMDLERPLSASELAAVRELLIRRRKREPVAYILGRREFYRRSFEVSPSVLIPRPDTETLVERALQLLPENEQRSVLDLCTGSGAIAVTLAAERPAMAVDATDLSPDALVLARRNAERHGVATRVVFHQGDLFAALPSARRYDLVVANPPYIAEADYLLLAPEIREHEPALALRAGEDGFEVLRRLCTESYAWLAPGGACLFEVGTGQAERVAAWLRADARLHEVRVHVDLGGMERVIEAHAR